MKKIDKFSNDDDAYKFSFILRTTNPFEKMILDQLKDLIKDGCTQKEAIMKLMCANVINHTVLAAPELKSVQASKAEVIKKESINREISPNQHSKAKYEQKPVNKETIKNSSDDKQKKLQAMLEEMRKYGK